MELIFYFFILFNILTFTYATSPVCNALNPALLEEDVSYPSLLSENFTVIFPATLSEGQVTLVDIDPDDSTGGIAATFWHTNKRRIADGFIASFDFSYTGNSDGIAFVIQNDKIQNIEGNGGSGLGFFNGLDKYFAIGIDICPQLNRPTRYPCNASSDVLITVSGQGVFPAPVIEFGEATASRSLFPSNASIPIDVYYLADANEIRVSTGGFPLISAPLPVNFTSVEEHFGSRFGYFGFTASNGFNSVDAGTIKVQSFSLSRFISEVRVSQEDLNAFPLVVEIGKQVQINVVIVDSCNEVSLARKNALNITASRIRGELRVNSSDAGTVVLPYASIADRFDGSFALFFQMPRNILGVWSFFGTIDTSSGIVLLQSVPIQAAVETVPPVVEALPLWGLILLISLLSLLVLAMAYVIKRLYRYRQKLKEAEEDIEFGKEKRKVDELDKEVVYTMNPLMGTLDEMEAKLAENKKILESLRSGDYMVENVDKTIADLKAQNARLRKEMNDLKILEQKEDAVRGRKSVRLFKFRKNKQEFDQEKS